MDLPISDISRDWEGEGKGTDKCQTLNSISFVPLRSRRNKIEELHELVDLPISDIPRDWEGEGEGYRQMSNSEYHQFLPLRSRIN